MEWNPTYALRTLFSSLKCDLYVRLCVFLSICVFILHVTEVDLSKFFMMHYFFSNIICLKKRHYL